MNERLSYDPLTKSFSQLVGDVVGDGADAIVNETMENMAKAMGNDSRGGYADATSLRLENLDATMTSVLTRKEHLKLFNFMPRTPSIQQIYQWNRRVSRGSTRRAPGFREGGAPVGAQAAWKREFTEVKWMGVRGGVTQQAALTGQLGGMTLSPETEENENRTLELLEMVERWLLWGDERITDNSGNAVNYAGLIRQMESAAASHVIDMKGEPLSFDNLDDVALKFATEGKLLDLTEVRMFMSPYTRQDLGRQKYDIERREVGGSPVADIYTGIPLAGHTTTQGTLLFESSIMMDPVEGGAPVEASDANAPDAPDSVTATPADVGAGEVSNIKAGAYYYSVASFNDSGESTPRVAAASAGPTAGQKVTVTVPRKGTATGYRIYRGLKADGSDALWIATVPQPAAGDPSYVDLNQWIPGTNVSVLLRRNKESIVIPQMAPLTKFPLAQVSTTREFLLLLYHTLAVKAPEHVFVFKNIGRYVRP